MKQKMSAFIVKNKIKEGLFQDIIRIWLVPSLFSFGG